MFIRARRCTLLWARSIQPTSSHSMDLSTFWEATNNLWNLNVYYCIKNSPPLAYITEPDKSNSYHCILHLNISLISILILSSHVRTFLLVAFLLAVPLKSYMHSFSLPFVLHVLSTSSSFNGYGEELRSWISSLYNFLQPPNTTSLLGPNIIFSTLFSNICNACSFVSIKDKVRGPYKTALKITVNVVLNFTFYIEDGKTMRLHETLRAFQNFMLGSTDWIAQFSTGFSNRQEK